MISLPTRILASDSPSNYDLLKTPSPSSYNFLKTSPELPNCRPVRREEVDVSLVTQTTMERLHVMKDTCRKWTGEISIIVANLTMTDEDLQKKLAEMGCSKDRVKSSVYNEGYEKFPVNILRNRAIQQATTSHVLYIDIDLVPSANLHKDILHHRELLREDDRNAIVVPAFQLNPTPECKDDDALTQDLCSEVLHGFLPEHKKDLLRHYGHPFEEPEPMIYQFTGREHYYGHSSTGYAEWAQQKPLHSLEPILCLRSVRYEPYMVVRRCEVLPPYQEQFTGYGKNKVSWMWQIQRSGYHLFRLGAGFVIHYPHPESKSKRSLMRLRKTVGRQNVEVEQIARAFRNWLDTKVPDQETLPFCDGYQQDFAPT